MSTRKSMKLPVVITFIIIVVIIGMFATIKQKQIVCDKSRLFDDFKVNESVSLMLDGKGIREIKVSKTIVIPERFLRDSYLDYVEGSLNRTLEYLGDKASYKVEKNKLLINVLVSKNEVILLDNISFTSGGKIKVDSNTKSSKVVTLTVGDNYTDSDLMKFMKSKGYSCK